VKATWDFGFGFWISDLKVRRDETVLSAKALVDIERRQCGRRAMSGHAAGGTDGTGSPDPPCPPLRRGGARQLLAMRQDAASTLPPGNAERPVLVTGLSAFLRARQSVPFSAALGRTPDTRVSSFSLNLPMRRRIGLFRDGREGHPPDCTNLEYRQISA